MKASHHGQCHCEKTAYKLNEVGMYLLSASHCANALTVSLCKTADGIIVDFETVRDECEARRGAHQFRWLEMDWHNETLRAELITAAHRERKPTRKII